MKAYSFYHKETGLISGTTFMTSNPQDIAANIPPDHELIEGIHDGSCKRVDVANGTTVDYQPPAPDDDHEWNAASKRWHLKQAIHDRNERRAFALSRIAQLEAGQHRVIREAALGYEGAAAKLKDIDAEIIELRAQLK